MDFTNVHRKATTSKNYKKNSKDDLDFVYNNKFQRI